MPYDDDYQDRPRPRRPRGMADDDGGWIVLFVLGTVAGVAGVVFGGKAVKRFQAGGNTGELSPRRQEALAAVHAVVPSKYGDARWRQLAPSYDPDNLPSPGYTTCGQLPWYVGRAIGINTRGGLASVRDQARAHNAWVEADGTRRPRPGDFLLLGVVEGGQEKILHTCVVLKSDGTEWITADAGQGTQRAQEAALLTRTYDPSDGTLSSKNPRHPKVKILGWLDVDRYAPERIV